MGPRVMGIEGEGALGLFLYEAGVLDLGAGVAEDREFTMADSERQHVDRIAGSEGDSPEGKVEGGLGVAPFVFEGRLLGREVGVLPGDLLEDAGIVGPGG